MFLFVDARLVGWLVGWRCGLICSCRYQTNRTHSLVFCGDDIIYADGDVMVISENAYGYLSREIGIHRLVRLSPFDANKKRHTSFASVSALPITNNTHANSGNSNQFEIPESDLTIETCRSSGPGGQHANKTESAVRVIHKPTNISVFCQNRRSQVSGLICACKKKKK